MRGAWMVLIALLLASCMGGPDLSSLPTPAVAPVRIATPTAESGSGVRWCEWRQDEKGAWRPVLLGGAGVELMDTNPNHAWNIGNICPPKPEREVKHHE